MQTLRSLFDLVSGSRVQGEDDGPATRVRILILAALATLVFAAVFGLAAGSTDLGLAFANIYKLPMVVLLSALSAIPAGMLVWKIVGARHRASDLLMGLASANFTGTLVMAVLAPIVALYYHTSGYLGGTLAMGTCMLGLVVGVVVFFRATLTRIPKELKGSKVGLPLVVMCALQLLTMVQFIYLASPILPEITVFDGGMDALVSQ